MIFPIKIKVEWIIIAVLAAMLFFRGCGADEPILAESTTETNTVKKMVTQVDSSSNPGIKNEVPEKVNIIEHPEEIEIVGTSRDLSVQEQKEVKEANRYKDTTYFEHARVFSDIISEGRILQKDLVVETDHLETITTIKKTTVKNAGGFYVSPAVGYSPIHGVEMVEASLMYINKGDFGISAGAYYNLHTTNFGFKIGVHKKL